MENMQFTAIVLMALLTFKLLLLPQRVAVNPMVNKARKLMAGGISLLSVQFMLQYFLHLRAMGNTQAVMVNLLLFIPVSWMISLAVLNLQGKGRIKRIDKWIGAIIWIVCTILISVAAAMDGKLFSDTPLLHRIEIVCSILFAAMQLHYACRHTINLRAMRLSLQNYYDRDMEDMLTWMQRSVIILVILTLMVPVLIFYVGPWLALYGVFFFTSIFYTVDSFCSYVLSSAPKKLEEAEENEEGEVEEVKEEKTANTSATEYSTENSEEQMRHIERAVEQWTKNGCYLKSGLKLPIAAAEIGVPQYQFSAWLRRKNLKYSDWITNLRIEEAKRILLEHPEWTSEAVADHCGFSSREYFHRIFRSYQGMTPIKYQQCNGVEANKN